MINCAAFQVIFLFLLPLFIVLYIHINPLLPPIYECDGSLHDWSGPHENLYFSIKKFIIFQQGHFCSASAMTQRQISLLQAQPAHKPFRKITGQTAHLHVRTQRKMLIGNRALSAFCGIAANFPRQTWCCANEIVAFGRRERRKENYHGKNSWRLRNESKMTVNVTRPRHDSILIRTHVRCSHRFIRLIDLLTKLSFQLSGLADRPWTLRFADVKI